MDDKDLTSEEIAELWEAIRTTGRLASYMPSLKKMCDMALRAVPEGWQVVPKEPTREMRLRGYAGWISGTPMKDEYRADQCYTSMLAAAPKVTP